jgi:NAD(P)-dependent dehydrogenase (short-subunit alcohol dehydrogenase family)
MTTDRHRRSTLLGDLARFGAVAAGAVLATRGIARLHRRIDFAGRVVLVTGGSRGLGLAMARQLIGQGALVAICGRDPKSLDAARRDLSKGHRTEVLALPCDITDRDAAADMVRRVLAKFGHIDVLINNAGTIEVGPMEVMKEDDYEEALKTHLWGAFYVTRAALPSLRTRPGARIVNVTSIGGKVSVPHLMPYSVSKFAQVGFSEVLRAELLKDQVYVTTVVPGLMRTGSPRNAFFKGKNEQEYAWFKLGDSLPGLSMDAERAAGQILDACRYGDAEIVLSLPAKFGTKFHALFPGLSADLAGLVNRFFLPAQGGIGPRRLRGADSETKYSSNAFTALTDEAARRHNQMKS